MISESQKSKRIAKNTLLLYVRMLLLMVISLYTSRVVLSTLGIEDYGIYNVVGGVVAMFSLISGSLSASITRFLNYEMGRGSVEKLKIIFASSVTIQLLLSLFIVVLAETIGLWFLNNQMQISDGRIVAANWVFQLSILTFIINLISIPYNAAIIAHEKMSAFAYIGLYEGVAKLIIAFLIIRSPYDMLITYAVLMGIVALSTRLIYGWYCGRNFTECRFRFEIDKTILSKMFSFAGWNFIGAIAGVLKNQGVNVILNIFCGPIVNAARAISDQVNNAVTGFVTNFTMALNPQITQSYSSGKYDYMKTLLFQGSKLSYYILLLLSLPIIINTSYLLTIWLDNYPPHSVMFVQLTLILSMWESIASPMSTGLLATGNIKWYQICVGGLNLLNLPVSYVLLNLGYPPESVLVVAILVSHLALFMRLVFIRKLLGFSIKEFLSSVYCRLIAVTLFATVLPLALSVYWNESFASFLVTTIICIISTIFFTYCIGYKKDEQKIIKGYLVRFIKYRQK